MDDKLLVKQCLGGSLEAQKRLYELYAPKMLGVCYRYASSFQEAEDFLQEAYVTIFRKLHQYQNKGSLESWIYRIVVNTSLNGIKARHSFTSNGNYEELQDDTFTVTPGDYHDLIGMIRELPDGYRTIFNLYAIEGYSHDEIAVLLNIKPATSRSQYSRAREQLMRKLGAGSQENKKGGHHG